MFKGIVFDLDHTLFDRYATIRKLKDIISNNFREYLAEGITNEAFAENFCDSDKKYISGGWTPIFCDLERKGMFSKTPEKDTAVDAIRASFWHEAVPFSFTYSVLENIRARGIKTGIVTNGPSPLQRKKVDMLNLKKYMDAVVFAGDFKRQKPFPESFMAAAEKLSEKPENLLFVGDNPQCDIEGARNAGYKTLWVKTGGSWDEKFKRADFELDSIEEIPALLDSLA